MKTALYHLLLLIVFLHISCMMLFAENTIDSINVMGESYGYSRQDAFLKAKRDAVEKGIKTILRSKSEIKNFNLQKSTILLRTINSITGYKIVQEKRRRSDNAYYFKIEAELSLTKIKETLATFKVLLEFMDKPRIMVVIQEEENNYAEKLIYDYLTEREFELVDAAVVASIKKKEYTLIKRAIKGDVSVVTQLGLSNSADYVIVGKITNNLGSTGESKGLGLKTCQSNMTVKIVNCIDGRVIESRSSYGVAAHISEDVAKVKATEEAVKELVGKDLFEKIISSFQDLLDRGTPIDVIIKNVANYRTQREAKDLIRNLIDVVSVTKRGYIRDELRLSVLFKGNPDSFSMELDGKILNGKNLSIIDIIGNRVVFNLE